MTLPAISIPEIPIPLQIPEVIHPAIVHFVIAIPIVILLLELYNLAVKRRSISVFSLILLLIVAVAMFGAYLTGSVDGKAAWDALGTEGQSELKEHKLLGIYLVYASLGLVLFKLLFMAIGKTFGRILFILILGGFIAVTLNQGKEGGELVFKYGANNEAVADVKSDLEDAIDERDELQEKIDEAKDSVKEVKAPEASSSVETAPEVNSSEETAPKAISSVETTSEANSSEGTAPEASSSVETTPEANSSEETAPKAISSEVTVTEVNSSETNSTEE